MLRPGHAQVWGEDVRAEMSLRPQGRKRVGLQREGRADVVSRWVHCPTMPLATKKGECSGRPLEGSDIGGEGRGAPPLGGVPHPYPFPTINKTPDGSSTMCFGCAHTAKMQDWEVLDGVEGIGVRPPLAEGQVAGDQRSATLIALGRQSETARPSPPAPAALDPDRPAAKPLPAPGA